MVPQNLQITFCLFSIEIRDLKIGGQRNERLGYCIGHYLWNRSSVSGVVAYVFNETRSLIREMRATTREMHATLIKIHKEGERRHQEVMETLKQQHQDVVELLKQQHQDHQDIVELLKKGFGAAAT
jgi:uncharacterized surface protein with fasciclin (FAS1) repeats